MDRQKKIPNKKNIDKSKVKKPQKKFKTVAFFRKKSQYWQLFSFFEFLN